MNIISQVASKLESYGIETGWVNAEVILSSILGCRRSDLYIEETRLDNSQLKQLGEMVSRRISGEPLQYITGQAFFYGHEFLIKPGVFIPRPETEILVEAVLNLITNNERRITNNERRTTNDEPLILDLCTGCGNIAVSLTKALTHCRIICSDISEEAIALAKRNASLHGVSEKVEFIKADLFDIPKRYEDSFDMIISNPPYIPDEELTGLPVEVKKEPCQALDGGRQGMSFYRQIIKESPSFLKREGIITLELADGISQKIEELFNRSRQFCDIRVFKDLNGINRVITAIRIPND